jgi:hypothetical protein
MSVNMDMLKDTPEKLLGHFETAACVGAFGAGLNAT